MRIKALAAGLILSWTTASLAQSAPPPVFKFEMHGFASGSIFVQDGSLAPGSGQIGYLPTAVQPSEDKMMMGADFRQSRFAFSVTGPEVFGGATPKGMFEIDWMGGFGAGNVGEIHLLPRLRIGYAELNWGVNRILFGVNADLTAALGPVTAMHLGAPYFLVSGNMGFRRPGVFGYHMFGDVKNPNGWKHEFAWEVARAQWTDAAAAVGSHTCAGNVATSVAPPAGRGGQAVGPNVCAGEASGLPALQLRYTVSKGSQLSFFMAGHWNRVDRNGTGSTDWQTTGANAPLDVLGGNLGAKYVMGPVVLAGGGYVGKNLAPLYGGIGQNFYTNAGDVHEYGVWGQAGWNFTKTISAYQFFGVDRINDNDLPGSGFQVSRSVVASTLLQFREGGYALGLEWTHFRALYSRAGSAAVTAAQEGVQVVNQVGLTGTYFF